MFKSKKINPNNEDTIIGEGTIFEGKVKSEASVRVEGQIIGDMVCTGDVTIGEKGVVRSNISARGVTIAGTVHGNVTTTGKLIITSIGTLNGNTNAQSLIIDEGGIFLGTSRMDNKQIESDNPEKNESVKFLNQNEQSNRAI
jgi:cytoskeletal protein CcmA (bactofilin family)